MPRLSRRMSEALPSGGHGWDLHFRAQALRRAGTDVIQLTVGDHDFHTPDATVEAGIEALRAGRHHYTDLQGLPRLRAAMATLTQRITGVETVPAEVMAVPGGQAALFAAIQACADPGDHAIVIGPYYATYPGTLRLSGLAFDVAETTPEDGFLPRLEALEAARRATTRLVLMNSPNNPTGAIFPPSTLAMIAEFCRKHDLWLISDEVYWSHCGDGRHVSPLGQPGMAERTVVLNSLSKSHGMTGWRVGWLRAPASVIEGLFALSLCLTYGLPDFTSHAAIAAVEGEHGVATITDTYRRRRAMMRERLAAAPNLIIRGSEGGMYVLLDVRAVAATGAAFALGLLMAEHVAVLPAEAFGSSVAGHVRISLGETDERLAEAADRIVRHASGERRAA